MDDRELNLKMAEMCGVELADDVEPLVTVGGDSGFDPVLRWDHVFTFVVPALTNAGFTVVLTCGPSGCYDAFDIFQGKGLASEPGAGGQVDGLSGNPKALCEAAWEAWQQLEKR